MTFRPLGWCQLPGLIAAFFLRALTFLFSLANTHIVLESVFKILHIHIFALSDSVPLPHPRLVGKGVLCVLVSTYVKHYKDACQSVMLESASTQ